MGVVSKLAQWVPPLALMGVIYLLSAQPDLNSGLGIIDLVGRKFIHAAEFGLLCFLWWRPLAPIAGARRAVWVALALTVAYAASDEYHQSFVHGRHAAALDVAIDALGASLGARIAWLRA